MLRQLSFLINLLCIVLVSVWLLSPAHADRLKDMASIEGVRSNQLIGYGLVVGLDGTGDKTPFTSQTFRNLMNQFGITIPPGVDPKAKNIAAVAVHADLPAFAKPGQRIDVTVSSLGDSKSLRGGSLLMTPLKGADGRIY
ncbi:flagellar basal body P-ring protein FlgI, partial [Oleiphilus sp. HI0067]